MALLKGVQICEGGGIPASGFVAPRGVQICCDVAGVEHIEIRNRLSLVHFSRKGGMMLG